MALVMALSLCGNVWAEGESTQEKTKSDVGFTFTANSVAEGETGSKTLYFFDQIDDGYMTYNRNVTSFPVAEGKFTAINVYPLEANDAIFLAFQNDNSLGTIADGADASNIISEHIRDDATAKFNITYKETNDTTLYVVKLTAKEALGTGETPDFFDFSFYTDEEGSRKEYQFAIQFANGGTGEGEGGGAFAGMKAALEADNTVALAYVDSHLVDSTGYVKASADDTTGIPLKDSYNETEKATIIAAVKAFREIDWEQRDPLGNVGGIQIKDDWYDCFGHYLAEMAASVGISLWGDYPSRNGVKLRVGDRKISFYTDQAYGVPAYDPNVKVTANNENTTYTIPYSQTYYCFAIPASKEIKSLTVKGAVSTELKDNDENVIGHSAKPFADKNITVETWNEGWFGDDSNRTYMFSVQISYDREEYTLPLVITYQDGTTEEFTVNAVDPDPWIPSEGVTPANAPGYLQKLYSEGFKAPKEQDFRLEFPKQLHSADAPAADGHWDYRWSYNESTGTITIEVNSEHEECWKNCVGIDDVLSDGVYFHFRIGGSESNPLPYGADCWDEFAPTELPDTMEFGTRILTSDYHSDNGWQLATINKRSATTTVLTMKEGTVCRMAVVSMNDSDKDSGGDQLLIDSEGLAYKYALQIDIVTDATKAIKLDTEVTQKLPKDRIEVDVVDNALVNDWNYAVPEDGTVFMLYKGNAGGWEKATTMTNPTVAGTSKQVGIVKVEIPNGYTTLNYTVDDCSGNYISSYDPAYGPIDIKSWTDVSFPIFKAQYNLIKLTWTNDKGDTLIETLRVEMGDAKTWMDLLGNNVTKPTTVMDAQTDAFLQQNGIYVTYDPKLGYFSTRVDAGKMNDISALQYGAELKPIEGAVYFKFIGHGGSETPFSHGQERANEALAYFEGDAEVLSVELITSGQFIPSTPFIKIDTLVVNGLTVYFADNQLYDGVVVQWLDAEKNIIGYSYVYGRNGDFVTAVQTQCVDEVNRPVDKPTLEGFDTDPGFTCDKNPQTGSQDGRKVFFQFDVRNDEGHHSGKYVIYLPYEYFNMTKEQGLALAAQGQHPVVYHYLDESCANAPDVIEGEYTEYGVRFETGSFSPFVIDCSGSGNDDGNGSSSSNSSSTGGHEHVRRYPTTPGSTGNGTTGSTGATGSGNTVQSAATGDAGIVLYAALCVSSLLGMGYAGKKRH